MGIGIYNALAAHNRTALQAIPDASPESLQFGTIILVDTQVAAFRHVWIAAVCFVALATIAAGFLFDPRKEFNMHVTQRDTDDSAMEAESCTERGARYEEESSSFSHRGRGTSWLPQ